MTFTLFRYENPPRIEKDISADIISGNPVQHSQLVKSLQNESIKTGIWESTAGVFKAVMSDQVEFCHILEGGATIKTSDGNSFSVTAGDAFVMDNALELEWTVDEYIKKHFVICTV